MRQTRKKTSSDDRKKPAHLRTRLRALRAIMDKAKVDAMLITHRPNLRYLTGFTGEDSWLLVTRRTMRLISDFRFTEQLQQQCPFIKPHIRKGPITNALAEVAGQLNIHRMGFEADDLTVAMRQQLVKLLGAKTLKPMTETVITLRRCKDKQEQTCISRAIAIQEQAYRQLLDELKPGMSEQTIAARLEYHMRCLGAEAVSFPTIAAIGPNAALPHAEPGERQLKANVPLLLDFGAVYQGYCSDLTRVVVLGKMPEPIRTIYRIVRQAQQAAIAVIRPGIAMKKVDDAARQIIIEAGYGGQFGHGLGHGIGLEVHEKPTLSPRSTGPLQLGDVVTIEPGIYLPNVGGVRIEDDVLVTEQGARLLSRLPADMESAMI